MSQHLKMSVNRVWTEYKQRVNNFGCCIWYKPRAKRRLLSIIEVLATCIGNVVNVVVTTRKNQRHRASNQQQQRVIRASTVHQQCINNFGCCILYNPRAVLLRLPIIKVLAAFRGNMVSVNVTTPQYECQQSINRASTECQQSWVLYRV